MAIVLDGTAGITTPDLTDTSLTSGRVVYAGASGNLTGSASLVFDGTNLGVGITNPSDFNSDFNDLVVGGSGARGITIYSSNSDSTNLAFADGFTTAADEYRGLFQYAHSDNSMRIFTDATERARFNSTGAFVLAGGTTTANGIGITFPATQSASSDANTLDDYEEGTWTPTLGGTATYSQQSGRYTKVGRIVTISFDLGVSTLGTGVAHTISGLPFAQGSGVVRSGITIPYYAGLAVNVISIVGIVDGTASSIFFSSSAASSASITDFIYLFGNGARVMGSGTYITAT